jgi:hypothetical protein
MKNKGSLVVCSILVVILNILGNRFPPASIMLTPVLIAIATVIIISFTDFQPRIKLLSLLLILIMNDLLIDIFAGGSHDLEGIGWISLFFLIGLFISFFASVFCFSLILRIKIKRYVGYLLLYIFLALVYKELFATFNYTEISKPSPTVEVAKNTGIFVADLHFSANVICLPRDTVTIESGWVEKVQENTDYVLFKKTRMLAGFNYVCRINKPFNTKLPRSAYYRWKSQIYGSGFKDNQIVFEDRFDSITRVDSLTISTEEFQKIEGRQSIEVRVQ